MPRGIPARPVEPALFAATFGLGFGPGENSHRFPIPGRARPRGAQLADRLMSTVQPKIRFFGSGSVWVSGQFADFDTDVVDLQLELRHPLHLNLKLLVNVLDLPLDEGQDFHGIP